jgi:hypothetical protein
MLRAARCTLQVSAAQLAASLAGNVSRVGQLLEG